MRIGCIAVLLSAACGGSPHLASVDGGTDADVDAAMGPTTAVPALLPTPPGSTWQSEPTIAIAPDGTLLVMWLDNSSNTLTLGFTFSTDHGDTWSAAQRLTLPGGRFASNEIVAADANSNFFVVTLGVDIAASMSSVYIAEAAAGTQMFGAFTEVSDPSIPAIRDASAFTIANDGSFNVAYNEYLAPSSTIVVARSIDSGVTWSWNSVSPAGGFERWPNICASRTDGHVAIVYVDDPNKAVGVSFSEDNGNSWLEADVNAVPITTNFGEFPSCVARGADLWIMQGVSTLAASQTYEPTLDDIQLTHSADFGRTLDATVSAQDPAAGPKFMRAILAIEEDQSLSLSYYAGKADNDAQATLRRSISKDGGKTFGASQIVYSPIVLTTSRTGTNWLGDLMGTVAASGNTHIAFVDNASGNSHIRHARLTP